MQKRVSLPYGLVTLGIKEKDPRRGERIATLMERGGWSDSHLATVLDVRNDAPGRWKRGAAISSPNVGPLAQVLGVNREWLVTGEGESSPPSDSEQVASVKEELAAMRSSFLEGLGALSKQADEQRSALEDLLQRVERLERE
jgi:transcriptional regulator with XRE-family HTH domain